MSITLYSNGCPKCKVMEKILNSKHLIYKLISNEEIMIQKGFRSAPMLEIDGVAMSYQEAMGFLNR